MNKKMKKVDPMMMIQKLKLMKKKVKKLVGDNTETKNYEKEEEKKRKELKPHLIGLGF